MRLAFVDLETTGGNPLVNRVTEVGVVLVDEIGVREWSQLVNPQTRIPAFIERLTVITNDMVVEAPRFEGIAQDLNLLLEGYLFIAHNVRFDYGFLKNEFKRLNIVFRPNILCSVKLSRALFPYQKWLYFIRISRAIWKWVGIFNVNIHLKLINPVG